MRGLAGFAEAHGVDPHSHATFDLVPDDGRVLDRSSRTWTNAERIPAAAAMFELEGQPIRASLADVFARVPSYCAGIGKPLPTNAA